MRISSLHLGFMLLVLVDKVTSQVLQIGLCSELKNIENFDLKRFLGKWYEIERFPTWYERGGQCAYKDVVETGDDLEIEHHYVLDDVEFVLHVQATSKGSVFNITPSTIDTVGIPLQVVATDYQTYAVIFGCRHREQYRMKYLAGWILSRERTVSDDVLQEAYSVINSLPQASTVFLEKVDQGEKTCSHSWTAHVNP